MGRQEGVTGERHQGSWQAAVAGLGPAEPCKSGRQSERFHLEWEATRKLSTEAWWDVALVSNRGVSTRTVRGRGFVKGRGREKGDRADLFLLQPERTAAWTGEGSSGQRRAAQNWKWHPCKM